jgi:hypothetical protein
MAYFDLRAAGHQRRGRCLAPGPPTNYWELDSPEPGQAIAAISEGQDGPAIVGRHLMNGYFTIFDGAAGLGFVICGRAMTAAPDQKHLPTSS